jgi:DNA-binding NtrC family response regulator
MSARRTSEASKLSRIALVVHPNMERLASFQSVLTTNDFMAIIARDLPTALLAITQHPLDVAIVSSRVQEEGDGWALAGVIHLACPKSFVCVTSATDPDIFILQSAINNGAREVYLESNPASDVVKSILCHLDPGARKAPPESQVQ